MLRVLGYKVQVPTVIDFLKSFMIEMLEIKIVSKTETEQKEAAVLRFNGLVLSVEMDSMTSG